VPFLILTLLLLSFFVFLLILFFSYGNPPQHPVGFLAIMRLSILPYHLCFLLFPSLLPSSFPLYMSVYHTFKLYYLLLSPSPHLFFFFKFPPLSYLFSFSIHIKGSSGHWDQRRLLVFLLRCSVNNGRE